MDDTYVIDNLTPQTTPLVFDVDQIVDLSVQNILFVHSPVSQLQVVHSATTFAVVYDFSSSTDEVMALLASKFHMHSSISRIGFAFHYSSSPYFMNGELLFADSDLASSESGFSKNLLFLIHLIRERNVSRVDFLACNTLLDDRWKQYYQLLQSQTGVIVGASDNNTGNLKYGGDWIMESTQEDISQVYFSSEISNFASLLDTYTETFGNNSVSYTYTPPGSGTTTGTATLSGATIVDVSSSYTVLSSFVFGGVTYSVTSIGNNAFQNKTKLTSITFPASVTSIGSYSFKGCTGLTSITLPTDLKTIENFAFEDCSNLTGQLIIPSGVTTIGEWVFNGAPITSLMFAEPVDSDLSVGNFAFRMTKIKYIDLSKTKLRTIPGQMFHGSSGSIQFGNRTVILPYGVTTIGGDAFNFFNGGFDLLILPETLNLASSNFSVSTEYFYHNGNPYSNLTTTKLIMFTSSDAGVTKQYYQYVNKLPNIPVAYVGNGNVELNTIIRDFSANKLNTSLWTRNITRVRKIGVYKNMAFMIQMNLSSSNAYGYFQDTTLVDQSFIPYLITCNGSSVGSVYNVYYDQHTSAWYISCSKGLLKKTNSSYTDYTFDTTVLASNSVNGVNACFCSTNIGTRVSV